MLELSIAGLSLDHFEAFSSICCFLARFLLQGVDSREAYDKRLGPVVQEQANAIQRYLQQIGPSLVQ